LLFANRVILTEFGKLIVDKALDVVDPSVYSNGNRAWRSPYSAKKGKSNIKKLWRGGRCIELTEMTNEEIEGLFVRSKWPGVIPITTFANASSGEPTKKCKAPDNGEPKTKKRKTDNKPLSIKIAEASIKIAEAYLKDHRSGPFQDGGHARFAVSLG
jgi:hypothetical protein